MTGFWKGPTGNDTIVLHSKNSGQTFPEFDFTVPDGETWHIRHIMHLLYSSFDCNPQDILIHIFHQRPDLGEDVIIWSQYAHFAQARTDAAGLTTMLSDVGAANYWRYVNEDVDLPLFGPCRVYIGMWNGTEHDAAAHLTFAVEKG